MGAALMNGLFNSNLKGKKVRNAVRVGHYGLRALEARERDE